MQKNGGEMTLIISVKLNKRTHNKQFGKSTAEVHVLDIRFTLTKRTLLSLPHQYLKPPHSLFVLHHTQDDPFGKYLHPDFPFVHVKYFGIYRSSQGIVKSYNRLAQRVLNQKNAIPARVRENLQFRWI